MLTSVLPLVALVAVHVAAVPVDTTVCDVLANPSAFDGKLVRFRAGVLTEWHHGIALMGRDCQGAIQLASTGAVPAEQTEAFDAAVGTPLKGGFDRTAVATFTGRISWKPRKERAYMDNPLKLAAHLIHQIEVSPRWSR